MSVDFIKSELFKLLSSEKESIYSSKNDTEKREHNFKYNIYNDYYMLLRKNDSFSYVFDLKDEILKNVLEVEKHYKELLGKYSKTKDIDEKNNMVVFINEDAFKIDCLNNIYNIINRNIRTNNSDYTNTSNEIITLISKLNTEKNKDKIRNIEEKIYNLREERRVLLSSKSESYLIKQICELESIEERIASIQEYDSVIKFSKKEFLNTLKETIQAINEYYFLDYKKSKHYKEDKTLSKEENAMYINMQFDNYVNRYYSLISTAFNDNFHIVGKKDIRMSTDDLINYLAIYNLDRNYEIFRSKNKNRLIGNKDINKTDYDKKVDVLSYIVSNLIQECSVKIKTKEVNVTDSRSDKNALYALRDKKIIEIENIILGEMVHARK